MGTSPSPYSPEFRQEAIRLAQHGGLSRRQIARALGISTETLRQWLKQADIDAGIRHDGPTTEETEEVRRLRREITLLREEREILVQAGAFFAHAQRAPDDSRRSWRSRSMSERRPTIGYDILQIRHLSGRTSSQKQAILSTYDSETSARSEGSLLCVPA